MHINKSILVTTKFDYFIANKWIYTTWNFPPQLPKMDRVFIPHRINNRSSKCRSQFHKFGVSSYLSISVDKSQTQENAIRTMSRELEVNTNQNQLATQNHWNVILTISLCHPAAFYLYLSSYKPAGIRSHCLSNRDNLS